MTDDRPTTDHMSATGHPQNFTFGSTVGLAGSTDNVRGVHEIGYNCSL